MWIKENHGHTLTVCSHIYITCQLEQICMKHMQIYAQKFTHCANPYANHTYCVYVQHMQGFSHTLHTSKNLVPIQKHMHKGHAWKQMTACTQLHNYTLITRGRNASPLWTPKTKVYRHAKKYSRSLTIIKACAPTW